MIQAFTKTVLQFFCISACSSDVKFRKMVFLADCRSGMIFLIFIKDAICSSISLIPFRKDAFFFFLREQNCLFVISHIILIGETIENKMLVKIKISIGCARTLRGKEGRRRSLVMAYSGSEGKKKLDLEVTSSELAGVN